MARSNVELSEQELIERYVERHPGKPGIVEARLRDYGISVWALAGYFPTVGGDIHELATAYDIPLEAASAAIAYYRRHAGPIDARIAANDPDDV
jgi:uncharacterized protein (DUF433 family)